MVPQYATINTWVELSGVSRTVTYELLGTGKLIGKKLRARLLIDVTAGLAFINSLPPPKIRPSA